MRTLPTDAHSETAPTVQSLTLWRATLVSESDYHAESVVTIAARDTDDLAKQLNRVGVILGRHERIAGDHAAAPQRPQRERVQHTPNATPKAARTRGDASTGEHWAIALIALVLPIVCLVMVPIRLAQDRYTDALLHATLAVAMGVVLALIAFVFLASTSAAGAS